MLLAVPMCTCGSDCRGLPNLSQYSTQLVVAIAHPAALLLRLRRSCLLELRVPADLEREALRSLSQHSLVPCCSSQLPPEIGHGTLQRVR